MAPTVRSCLTKWAKYGWQMFLVSSDVLDVVESKPFLDVTNLVLLDTELGLMGMAFHPNFEQNGRFFLSFSYDKMRQPGCFGRCSCTTDVKCDPAKLVADNGVQPCQYHNIIAEYTANNAALKPSMAHVHPHFTGVKKGKSIGGEKDTHNGSTNQISCWTKFSLDLQMDFIRCIYISTAIAAYQLQQIKVIP
ncbi:hypothetical protein SLEP1_g2971 [Rubroshorea leprosula]|uniref:Uncharacterized protein n=1 Tax=Rubroshorea leprosula TaxID=152421 RepID=A0AAV5HSM0_9ROSI|nr:hypothetical protein SLEP1_g2971 [Rubroshorea leprosula]